MKINRAIPIEKLMKSLDYYLEKTNRRITIEYILLKDVNDHQEEAEQLAMSIRAGVRAMPDPPPESMFDSVYAEAHPAMDEQRQWLLDYEASFSSDGST